MSTSFNPETLEFPDFQACMVLTDLQGRWNNLHSEDYDYDYNEHDYKRTLEVFKEVIESGSSNYQNPFGADDTECFEESFQRLNKPEQRAFYAKAIACHAAERLMTESDIEEIIKIEPTIPLFIDFKNGSDKGERRGTERRPFKTEEAVMKKLDELMEKEEALGNECDQDDLVYSICSTEECPLRMCSFKGCRTKICDTHGAGYAKILFDQIWWKNFECDIEKSEPEPLESEKTKKEGADSHRRDNRLRCPAVFCSKHGEGGLTDCEICYMKNCVISDIEGWDCGASDVPKRCCKKHMTVCEGQVKGTGKVCGYHCCPDCLDDHECGVYISDPW